MTVLQETLIFLVKIWKAWYLERYKLMTWSYLLLEVEVRLVEAHELTDPYPQALYIVSGRHLISLKRYMH